MALSRRKKIVVDTSIFVNPKTRSLLGKTPAAAFSRFLELSEEMKNRSSFYMPKSVFKELSYFIEIKEIPKNYDRRITIKQPKKHRIDIPSTFLYELIDDLRKRVNKGLRISESAVRARGKADEAELIKSLREKYKEALRQGVIDSKEDVDILVLAEELDGALLTCDEGLIDWADRLGIETLDQRRFIENMVGR